MGTQTAKETQQAEIEVALLQSTNIVPRHTGRYIITNRNVSQRDVRLHAVLTFKSQVPILPDVDDQIDIVTDTQKGEPDELVRCILRRVDP
jgi:hypothetical protein